MSSSWIMEQENLLNEDKRINALNALKNQLVHASDTEMIEISNNLRLPLVFDCLENSKASDEQLDLACEVLTLCLENLSIGESINRYSAPLEKALGHSNEAVKLMALREIHRTAKKNPERLSDSTQTSLIIKLCECVKEDNLSVGTNAVTVLCLIMQYWITNANVVNKLRNVMESGDIQRFRVYEIAVNTATKSAQHLIHVESAHFLSQLISELESNDELLQLNALELLTQLALSEHGLTFLENKNVFKGLAQKIENVDQYPLSHILIPGLIKFFGNVAHWKPMEIFNNYQNVMNALFDVIISNADVSLLPLSLDTIGYLGTSNEGKIALNSMGNKFLSVLKQIGSFIHDSQFDIKIHSMKCLANLMLVETTDVSNMIEEITHRWFALVTIADGTAMDLIFEQCHLPFPDTRVAAFNVLLALSSQIWGQELIENTPGLIEFLLDRSVEHSKEVKEVKYEVVSVLARSSIFDNELHSRLERFVIEGPFHIDAIAEVAIIGE